MWNLNPKGKHILKNKHDNIQTYMYNRFAIVELPYVTQGRRDGKRE
jgi:hypothetical protein